MHVMNNNIIIYCLGIIPAPLSTESSYDRMSIITNCWDAIDILLDDDDDGKFGNTELTSSCTDNMTQDLADCMAHSLSPDESHSLLLLSFILFLDRDGGGVRSVDDTQHSRKLRRKHLGVFL